MRITRPITRGYGHRHPHVCLTDTGELTRGGTVGLAPMAATDAGPAYKGMDPSDPSTWVRPWNPQPGMISRLNYDGAALQSRTPTGLQRGSQWRGARGSR